MISFADDIKILICSQPIDMRKSIDGLVILVVDTLKQDPQAKQLYLFYNKTQNKLKGIFWDNNGFIMLYKKMERKKFIFPQDINSDYLEIDSDLFKWLLKGFDFYRIKHNPELKFTQYY